MLMLNLAKSFVHQHTQIAAGKWPRRAYQPLRGRTLGVVGLGRTGKATTTRARAFGMTVLATDPVQDTAFAAAQGVEFVGLEELLRRADYVSLHVPLTPSTRKLINAETLRLLRPTSCVINCSRSEVIDEAALLEALTTKRLAGAGLDVFEHEPPGDNPLTKLDNVVLTAHTAGVDWQSRNDMARVPAECIAALMTGGWPTECVVNGELRGTWTL